MTRFAYDDQNAWADLNGSNALQTRRFYQDGVDQLFGRSSSSGAVAWYLADRLGSVRDLTDGTGAVQDHLAYDGYGNVVTETNVSFGDRYKFTSREVDAETGLQYNRARFYHSKTGRWISQDPLGLAAGDTNLYRYVLNGPTLSTDPSGQGNDGNDGDKGGDPFGVFAELLSFVSGLIPSAPCFRINASCTITVSGTDPRTSRVCTFYFNRAGALPFNLVFTPSINQSVDVCPLFGKTCRITSTQTYSQNINFSRTITITTLILRLIGHDDILGRRTVGCQVSITVTGRCTATVASGCCADS